MHKADYVTVIGGANIDISGFSREKLRLRDSNPGTIKLSLGGVGRNIAENITKLGLETVLITAVGDDLYGQKILNECKWSSINIENIMILQNMPSSIYLSILDNDGDMQVALSDMEAIDYLDIDYIKSKDEVIENSKCLVLDTNLKKDVIEYILIKYQHKDIFVDTVSVAKTMKIKGLLKYIHTLKPNKLEAEELTGIKINDEEDTVKAITAMLKAGVKSVIISLGKNGVIYGNQAGIKKLPAKPVKVINATGAGDAFMAGLIYGYCHNLNLTESCKIASAAASLTLKHQNTINPNLSIDNICNEIKGMN